MSNPIQNLAERGCSFLQHAAGDPVVTFLENGKPLYDVPCVVSMLMRGNQLDVGGRIEDVQCTITILKRDLQGAVTADDETVTADDETVTADSNIQQPHPGKTVRVNARNYRILTVDEDGVSAAWRCHLGSVNR